MPHSPIPTGDWSKRSLELSQLLASAGGGDRAAFAKLYRLTSPILLGVVYRISSNRAEAEDVLQETYVKVWRAASIFDPAKSQPLTWLTSIARHQAIDAVRSNRARPELPNHTTSNDEDVETVNQAVDSISDPAAGPLELLGRVAEARRLNECIERLSPMQRQCLALAFFDGLSHVEVANSMGKPLGTVKSWLRRALLTLRSCLDPVAR